MKSLACAGFLTLFCVTAGAADTWQYEGALVYNSLKQNSAPNLETSAVGAGISYSFSPLPYVGNYPLAESQFAERVGNVSLIYLDGSVEADFLEKTDVNAYGATVTLMHPNSDLAFQVGYNKFDYKDSKIKGSSTQVSIDADTVSVAIGYFVQKYLMIALEHTKDSADYSFQPSATPSSNNDTTTNQLIVQYFTELNNKAFFAGNLSLRNIDTTSTGNLKDTNTAISFRGTYYLNKMHGISLELGQNSGDDASAEGNWNEVGYKGFITNSISMNAAYKKFSIKDSSQGSDENNVMAGLSVRF